VTTRSARWLLGAQLHRGRVDRGHVLLEARHHDCAVELDLD
jgi:hypothetical protein